MNAQRIRVISSPSRSTIGFLTLIFATGARDAIDTRWTARQSEADASPYDGGQAKDRSRLMNTYVIRREQAWQSPEELEETAGRSKQVAEDDFPDDIRWIRSYVISEEGGTLGTVCIYQATDIDAVRAHAKRVDMPADEVLEVADTVIIRPDPEPAATS